MRVFYVTVLVIFSFGGDGAGIGVFAGFFEGGCGKRCAFMWCFCGDVMVDCVVFVER
jgi:hypothetical protein